MASDVEGLRALTATPDGLVRVRQAVVDSVQANGTLNLSMGGTLFPGIAREQSYTAPVAGDVVHVMMSDAGWWVAPPTGLPAVVGPVATTATRWGEDEPVGTGWLLATSVWVRDGEVYAQIGAPAPPVEGEPPPPPPPPSTAPTNSPKKTIPTTDDGEWQGGHKASFVNGGHPVQGGYGSNPNVVGAWFYGNTIASGTAGKTVQSLSVHLVRRNSGGQSGGVHPRLFLHDYATPPYGTPTLHDLWVPDKTLGWGEAGDFTLPASWRDQLVSGAAKGIGCSAPNGNSFYVQYSGSAPITATYL